MEVIKLLSGLNPNEFENNTPKDGPIDRSYLGISKQVIYKLLGSKTIRLVTEFI